LYTLLFYVIIPTLFLYFLLFCYPYILLNVFMSTFSSRHMPELKVITMHMRAEVCPHK